jgi:hypothetical protein
VSGRIWATNQNVTSIYCRAARSPGNPALGAAVAASPYTAAATARDLAVACDLTGLAAGTSYGVRMYAVDSDGTSSAGNTVTFTTGTSGGGGGGAPAPETTPTATPHGRFDASFGSRAPRASCRAAAADPGAARTDRRTGRCRHTRAVDARAHRSWTHSRRCPDSTGTS